MYTAACSVKGWPQKRAGAVETFLKTFVSASRWISLSLSVVRKKRLSPKYRACSPVLLVAVLSCLVLSWLNVSIQSIRSFVVFLSHSLAHTFPDSSINLRHTLLALCLSLPIVLKCKRTRSPTLQNDCLENYRSTINATRPTSHEMATFWDHHHYISSIMNHKSLYYIVLYLFLSTIEYLSICLFLLSTAPCDIR